MTTLVLYTQQGSIHAASILLLCDHLNLKVELQKLENIPHSQITEEDVVCLKASESDYIWGCGSILTYLARRENSKLYQDSCEHLWQVDSRLELLQQVLAHYTKLAKHCRGQVKLDGKQESLLRKSLTQSLKDYESMLKLNEKLEPNVSDVLAFGALGTFLDANTQKEVKGNKGLK